MNNGLRFYQERLVILHRTIRPCEWIGSVRSEERPPFHVLTSTEENQNSHKALGHYTIPSSDLL
jgi:hypothetical protein